MRMLKELAFSSFLVRPDSPSTVDVPGFQFFEQIPLNVSRKIESSAVFKCYNL